MSSSPIVRVTSASSARVPEHATRMFGPGQVCMDAEVGDVVLVRSGGLIARAIRLSQRLRVPALFAWANHAAVVLTPGPSARIVSESRKGATLASLADMVAECYTVTQFTATTEQFNAGTRFLTATLGTGYGYLTFLADAFNALTGLELALGWGNRMVCSTQTARFLERIGYIPERSPYAVTPGHLAWALSVTEPKD